MDNKKIIYLVTEDWYFCSHRLSLAVAAKNTGFEVIVVTRVKNHRDEIERNGIKIINIDFHRRSKNIFKMFMTIRQIINIYIQERPLLVHHISLKPVVLGTVASLITRVPFVVNALTGLGSVFVSESLIVKTIKIILVEPILNILFSNNTWIILQNIDDKKRLKLLGVISESRSVLIRGSGVNTSQYINTPEKDGDPIVVFASRMIKHKGVAEFVAAAESLKKEKVNAKFVLVGDTDPGNPSSYTKDTLFKLQEEGIVEWWGYRKDMSDIFKNAHIICLPSLYGEGLPKVLLEAAASGRPIIASDIPGCREIVRDGENGILVPAKNTEALAKAIRDLINDKSMRQKMGDRGREIVENEFSTEIINSQTLELYQKIIGGN